jgi:hypothetical protein
MFLDETETTGVNMPTHSSLRPLLAFLAGLVVAIVFTMLIALIRILIHFGVDEAIRTALPWSFNFRLVQFGLAIFTQVLLACLIALFFKRLGWAHGLFAAFVAACFICFGLVFLIELSDCISIFRTGRAYSCANFLEEDLFLWAGPIIVMGSFLSFLPAFVMSWVGSLVRTLFSKTSQA